MTTLLTDHDRHRLAGVDRRLVDVVFEAAKQTSIHFQVACGLRTMQEQARMVAMGKSETMHSLHIVGRAVDLVVIHNGLITWSWQQYANLNDVMQQAAKRAGHAVTWGGSWKTIKDGDHWQLTASDPAPLQPWSAGT